MADRIQLRGDTAANWTSVNPVLAHRELAIETDTLKTKIGDGVTAWNSLSYGGIVGPIGPQGAKGDTGDTGPQGTTAWGDLTGKPVVFQPTYHVHGFSEVPGLDQALGLKAPSLNPTLTGAKEVMAVVSASNIDINAGNVFTRTISGATTFTVSNVPAAGTVASFILELTNGGSATVTWWAGVKWASGTAPTLTAAGVDMLGFYTHNGGTTWRGLLLAKDSK